MTRTGWLVVRDALTICDWKEHRDALDAHVRPHSQHDAEHLLLRTAECIEGEVEVEIVCLPLADYGTKAVKWSAVRENGEAADAKAGDLTLRLRASLPLRLEESAVVAQGKLSKGELCCCGLFWGDEVPGQLTVDGATERLDRTSHFWRSWVGAGRFADHRWRYFLQRSALALKGLTYAPTGAIIAALTTSLPETPGGQRNWDYRYTWIRDATFTLWVCTRSTSISRPKTSWSSWPTCPGEKDRTSRSCTGLAARSA